MSPKFITIPGYLVTKLIVLFPLSTRFLDEDYLADESRHLYWGLGVWTTAIALIGTGVAWLF